MRFKNPTTPVGNAPSGGSSGVPSWRRKWIQEQVRWVKLECGCIEDISIPVITFINAFDGTSIDCINCHRFVKVVGTIKRKGTPANHPSEPLF